MNISLSRLPIILIGILLVIFGLIIQNPIIGIIIALLLGLTVFHNDKIPILFLIIFMPVRPFLIVYNTGFKVIGDILIFFLLLKVIYDSRKGIRKLLQLNKLEIAFFLFILIGTISALITGVTFPAIIMQVRAFLLFFLLFFIVKRMNVNEKDIYHFSLVTFLTAVILSLQGLVEKISSRTLLLPESWANLELSPTNSIRVYGLSGGPNELGLYLFIAFLISFYLLSKVSGKFKIAVYMGMTLIFTIFLLTYSRGTVLAVVSFLIIYLILYRKIHYFKQVLAIISASILLFFVVVNLTSYFENYFISIKNQEQQNVSNENNNSNTKNTDITLEGLNRFTEALSEETIGLSSIDGRVYYVKKALEVFQDRPIIGYGFGTFGGAATITYSSPIYEDYGIGWNFYSDNQYIQILAETGLIGTLVMVMFIFYLIKFTWNLRKEHFFSPLLVYFIVASVTSATVYNILENDTFTMYYFILLGFSYRYLDKRIRV